MKAKSWPHCDIITAGIFKHLLTWLLLQSQDDKVATWVIHCKEYRQRRLDFEFHCVRWPAKRSEVAAPSFSPIFYWERKTLNGEKKIQSGQNLIWRMDSKNWPRLTKIKLFLHSSLSSFNLDSHLAHDSAFCSTSLPRASTRWVRLTLSSLCPLS